MKKLIVLLLFVSSNLFAQETAESIVEKYFENTGGKSNWEKLEGVKMTGNVKAGGMEIPFEMVQLKDGRQYAKITFQGKEILQGVFDGEKMWGINMMTQKPEETASEMTEVFKKNSKNDFPSAFLNYESKGYKAELVGEEVKEGTSCYKIKLTQLPVMIEGQETPAVSYFYFDKDNFIPILAENEVLFGPMKGQMMTSSMSDYQEVNGLYFPFSLMQGGAPLVIEKIELNPEVDSEIFKMPN